MSNNNEDDLTELITEPTLTDEELMPQNKPGYIYIFTNFNIMAIMYSKLVKAINIEHRLRTYTTGY